MTERPSLRLSRLGRRALALGACGLLLAAAPAAALDGIVLRAGTGQPIAGAEVSILGRPGVAITDAEGRFRWTPDPAPPFEVLVIAPGGVLMKPILVERLPGPGPLVLRVTGLADESVTVAGTAPGIETTPAAGTTLLSSRDIEVRAPANLVQMLENVAGVTQVSEGQAAVPAIRGLARGRTLILIDGARVTAERRAGPSATFLDPFVLESVEVARGPGSVAYGSDAFGGVIAARTRRVAPGAPFGVRFAGTLGGGVPERRASLELSKGVARGGVLFQAHVRDAGDWHSPEGRVINSGYRDQGFLVRGEHTVGGGLLSAGWQSDFGRDIERPRTNSNTVRFFYPVEDSHRFTARFERPDTAGFTRVSTSLFLGASAQTTDQDRFATARTGRQIERAIVDARDFQVRASGERPLGAARLEVGLDVNGRWGLQALDVREAYDLAGGLVSRIENVSIDTARRVDTGVYASLEAPLWDRATVSGGIRGDRVTSATRGGFFGDRSTANTAGSGFAAMSVGPFGRLSFTAQVARGFRDPVLSDRYFRGPTGRGFITGNPDLEPERSLQFDAAARYTSARLRLAAYVYRYRITDLIERFETTPDDFLFRNRGRARLQGVEVEAQADLGAGTTLELAAQIADGVALDDGADLDDMTPPTISAQLRKQFRPRAFAQVRVAGFADDDRPGPSEVPVAGYLLMDLSGGVGLGERLELRLLARNILDRAYRVSPDRRAVLAPGTSVTATAVVTF